MKLVITDSDHDAFAEEEAVAAQFGAELVRAQALTPDELIEAAADADGILVQYARITAEVMDALPKLKAIGRYGVGVDSVDVRAATERGIAVCNVPDYGTETVSDHALALALSMLRDVNRHDRYARAGKASFPAVRPQHLFVTRTFGVLGCGLIGSAIARKATALGFDVIVNDVLADPNDLMFHGYRSVSFESLLSNSDVLSIHIPLNNENRHFIDAEALALLKPEAVLVNTARGLVVDHQALYEALQSGRLRGAALDVLDIEPPPVDHPLMSLDNVTFTPHVAWYSEESYGELKRRTVENVGLYLSGREPRNILNPEVLQHPRGQSQPD